MLDLPDPRAAAAAATEDDRPVATASWRPIGTRSLDPHVTAEIAGFAERQGMNSLGCEIVTAAVGFAVRHAIHTGASGPFSIDAAAASGWLSVAITDLGAAARAMPAFDAGLRLVSDELRMTANGGSRHTVLTEFAIR
jgi:hypothetical protein